MINVFIKSFNEIKHFQINTILTIHDIVLDNTLLSFSVKMQLNI